jgi:hypothetical protein
MTAPQLSTAAARERRRTARNEYVRRLTDAWRHLPSKTSDAPEPNLGSRPAELMQAHLPTEESGQAQARRDAAWAAYRNGRQSDEGCMNYDGPPQHVLVKRSRSTSGRGPQGGSR